MDLKSGFDFIIFSLFFSVLLYFIACNIVPTTLWIPVPALPSVGIAVPVWTQIIYITGIIGVILGTLITLIISE